MATPAPLRHVGGDRLAQRENSVRRRITVMAVLQRFRGRLDDIAGCWKVGLTDAEIDDVLPCVFQLLRACEDIEGGLGAKPIEAVGEDHRYHSIMFSQFSTQGRLILRKIWS